MHIGELARRVGTSADTVRFYERSGWLPRAARRSNAYREYGDADAEHLRLLLELRRLGMPLAEAAQVAGWCHAGHCADSTAALPVLLAEQRAIVAERIANLQALDRRLADLAQHLGAARRRLPILELSGTEDSGASCCDAAATILGRNGGCSCCSPAATPDAVDGAVARNP